MFPEIFLYICGYISPKNFPLGRISSPTHRSTKTISQLIHFCQVLVSTYQKKFDMDCIDGMLASIILFPPWSQNLIKYFYSPLIVDATFSIYFMCCHWWWIANSSCWKNVSLHNKAFKLLEIVNEKLKINDLLIHILLKL